MTNFLGDKAKDIEIVCNDGKINDRTWEIIWRDDTIYGNDKSLSKYIYSEAIISTANITIIALIKARQEAVKDTIFLTTCSISAKVSKAIKGIFSLLQ